MSLTGASCLGHTGWCILVAAEKVVALDFTNLVRMLALPDFRGRNYTKTGTLQAV